MKNLFNFILFFLCFNSLGVSQGKFTIQNNKKSDKINFKLINNLIIIPVKVNDVELSFILDTGVSKTIIFNYKNISDSLKMKDIENKGYDNNSDEETLFGNIDDSDEEETDYKRDPQNDISSFWGTKLIKK